MIFRPELLDELLKHDTKPEDPIAEGGILKQLTTALVKRATAAAMEQFRAMDCSLIRKN